LTRPVASCGPSMYSGVGTGVGSGVAVGSGTLMAAGALVGATVDAATGAVSLDEPHAAVNSARRIGLVATASRVEHRHGALFSCAEIRSFRIDLNVRSIGFAPPCGIEIKNQPALVNLFHRRIDWLLKSGNNVLTRPLFSSKCWVKSPLMIKPCGVVANFAQTQCHRDHVLPSLAHRLRDRRRG
jgi:hypothetical protein